MVGLRGIAIRIVGLLGNIVLARLLVPADFGLIAFANAVMFFAVAVGDGGLGAGLVRRKEPPTPAELRSVSGFQLMAAGAFAVVVAAIAVPLGRPGVVAAVMIASLPIIAFRTPGALLLERQLDYRPLVVIEFAETVAFTMFAIVAVALGAGVWGLAGATTFRCLVGTVLMIVVSPAGLVRPSFDLKPLRSLMAFGVQFQATGFVLVANGLVMSSGVGALGGLRILGLSAIADRVMTILTMVTGALWRVSFPMMARLIEAGDDVAGLVARNVALVTFAVGLVGAGLVGAAPALVPLLFGSAYSDAVVLFPFECLAALIAVPVGSVLGGYLYANGRASAVLVPTVAGSLVTLAVMFPLLHFIGVVAVGVGLLAGSPVGAGLMIRAAEDVSLGGIFSASCRSGVAGVLAGAAGFAAATVSYEGPLGVLADGGAAVATYVGVMLLVERSLVRRAQGLLTLAFRGATARSAPPTEARSN